MRDYTVDLLLYLTATFGLGALIVWRWSRFMLGGRHNKLATTLREFATTLRAWPLSPAAPMFGALCFGTASLRMWIWKASAPEDAPPLYVATLVAAGALLGMGIGAAIDAYARMMFDDTRWANG